MNLEFCVIVWLEGKVIGEKNKLTYVEKFYVF